jgi:hypothetical protein
MTPKEKASKKFMTRAKKPGQSIAELAEAYQQNSADIDLDYTDGRHKALVDHAAYLGNPVVLIWLALKNATLYKQHPSNKKTPLHYAMQKGRIECAALLVLFGAPVITGALKPAGHTTERLKIPCETVAAFHTELEQLHVDGSQIDPTCYPTLIAVAPRLIGLIREVNTLTENRRMAVITGRFQLLKKVFQLINANEEATARSKEIVVHSPPKSNRKKSKGRRKSTLDLPSLRLESRLQEPELDKDGKPTEKRRPLIITALFKLRLPILYTVILKKEEIQYHHHLRIQFAFYQFVVYYKTRIHLLISDTKDQDGTGNKEAQTQAAHSATVNTVQEVFRWKEGLTIKDGTRPNKRNTERLVKPHFSDQHYLYHALAATTVTLHQSVNQYDKELEGCTTPGKEKPFRRTQMELLNQVSLGALNPLQALEMFLTCMVEPNGLLDNVRKDYVGGSADTSPSIARQRIHRYIFCASLQPLQRGVDGIMRLKRTHAANLLFMKGQDRQEIERWDEATLHKKLEPRFVTLQQEILSTQVGAP